jgi:hypothetical protein
LNALIATVTTTAAAPVIVGQRLRKGACGSPRGAARMIGDTLATVARLRSSAEATGKPLVRMDSAFYGQPSVAAAIRGGADVSVTVRLDPKVKAAIADIADDAWTTIEYTDALYDQTTQQWISRAEVAEIGFIAFSSRKAAEQVPGRLVVRRIPDLRPAPGQGQQSLFDTWRFHAFFTTTDLDTVTADTTHRGHAVIEQVHADLKVSALAHLPSGRFSANAAWLVMAVIAFNLTRAAATLTGPRLAKARTATIRRTLSRSRRGSHPRPDASPCTYREAGRGKQRGTPCSTICFVDITRSSPNQNTPTRPRHENPTGTTRNRDRALTHGHTPVQGTQPISTANPHQIGASRLRAHRRERG